MTPSSSRNDEALFENGRDPATSGMQRRVSDPAAQRGVWRRLVSLRASPLTRRIVVLNLIALAVLFCGLIYLNSSHRALVHQRELALVAEAELVADVIEVQMPAQAPVSLATGDGVDIAATLAALDLRRGVELLVFDISGDVVSGTGGGADGEAPLSAEKEPTHLADALDWVWHRFSAPFGTGGAPEDVPLVDRLQPQVARALEDGQRTQSALETVEGRLYTVVTPILQGDRPVGAVAAATAAGEIDTLLKDDRERLLQTFLIATLTSVGLSLVLASTIATPIADLAAAAEMGRHRPARERRRGRVRIPDMTGRRDEIGRLSGALRGMIAALYDRIDTNEQFAADVAHEIKNPLASLRSAVGTLRVVRRDDQRDRLLDVIDHDVRRLDRLVSDISNASRLDSELVKETEVAFDVLATLTNLSQFLGEDARARGIDFITDFPGEPVTVFGLEARLAQVFVNLISNAISFCEDGDAIRVWARKRDNRVLVVVEDTGPGIPEEALGKIFQRFYSHRPPEHFGNNSGLGLAISKQIVEAHGGVIWAENIRPTQADITSEPLGARFVVGLPI